jgi:outer membrane protein W
MKKLILLLVVLALVVGATQTVLAQPEQTTQTQSAYIKAGKLLVQGNVGYGGGAFIASGASFPIVPQVNVEYILADNAFGEGTGSFGIGGVGALGLYSIAGSNVTSIVAGVQGNYHFVPKAKFDPYIGLMLGFYTYTLSDRFGSISYSGLGWSGHAGANYWFSNGFGLHGRIGYGVAIISLGVTIGF